MNTTSAQAQAEVQAIIQDILQNIDQTIGAVMVGAYLSAIFYGVTLLQTYLYFSRYYKRDDVYLISLVIILTILDTLAVVGSIGAIWLFGVKNYDNPLGFLAVNWGIVSSLMTTAVIGFLVQSFYAFRAYTLGGKKIWIPLVIIVFGLSGMILGIIFVSHLTTNGSFATIAPKIKISTAALSCTLVSDIVILVSITRCLLQGRQEGFEKSNTLIRKLVIYTVNTGVLTTGINIVTLIVSQLFKNALYDVIFYYLLSKCYINSMLGFLNAREFLRNIGSNVVSLDHLGTAPLKFRGPSNTSNSGNTSELVGDVPPDVVIYRIPEKHESSSSTADQSKSGTTSVLGGQSS